MIVHLCVEDERTHDDLQGLWHDATPVVRLQ
ncbi:MAG: hypothetical protein IH864_04960 [Chloroflexi bacterium]|nr:hypothetical protein [Chloroflexota bacterium]